jgi:hypothetical protein
MGVDFSKIGQLNCTNIIIVQIMIDSVNLESKMEQTFP